MASMQQALQIAAHNMPAGIEVMPFGEALVAAGMITPDQLRIALHEQERNGGLLGLVLCRLGALDETNLCHALAARAGWRSLDAASLTPDLQLLRDLPHHLAERWQILPLRRRGDAMVLACADPYDIVAHDQARAYLGIVGTVEFVLAPPQALQAAIARSYGASLPRMEKAPEPGEVASWLVRLLQEAAESGASDIHFEPQPNALTIRFRLDGVLRQVKAMHRDFWPPLLQRLKITAGANIAESRKPQDGRFSQICGGVTVDFRVGFMPAVQGEAVAIRILDPRMASRPLEELGFSADQIAVMRRWLQRPDGLILATGPTGSGKSTTLHALLKEIDWSTRNVMTLEDPVEYQFEGIVQTQVNAQFGLGFAEGVRSLLRHDPDVILIGEIRDQATAQQAIRAAMTGHLVLSTLHTGDALGVVPRLLDLGVPRALLPGHLRGAIAQRLVRTLCPQCRAMRPPRAEESAYFPFGITRPLMLGAPKPQGCPECFGHGRRGRTLAAEVVEFTADMLVSDDVLGHGPGQETMWQHGLSKSCAGIVGFDDLLASVPPERKISHHLLKE